jgi:hypothetical protein
MTLSSSTVTNLANQLIGVMGDKDAIAILQSGWGLSANDMAILSGTFYQLSPQQKALLINCLAVSPTKPWNSVPGTFTATPATRSASLQALAALWTASPPTGAGNTTDFGGGALVSWLASNVA